MSVKRTIFNFSVALVFLFTVSFSYGQEGYKVKHVVIDAGHGGKDPGAVGKTAKEKDVALAIALKVGGYIKKNFKDVKVTYTRDKDVFIGLHKRAQIANNAKADLFISIHCNAVDSKTPHGTETWVMGMHKSEKNLKVAQKENAAILLETDYDKTYNNFDPYNKENYIRFSILQSEFRSQSILMASEVQKQFKNRVKRVDRGVKEAGFLVLVYTTMPAILIETGFLSNPAEEKFLSSTNGQELMASGIYRAFKKYKTDLEAANGNVDPSTLPTPTPEGTGNDTVKEAETPPQKPTEDKPQTPVSSTEVIIGIQFTSSTKKKDLTSFGTLEEVWYYEQNNLFKYVSGKYTDLEMAKEKLKLIRESGYKDAFLVYFQNGQRIKRSEAVKLLK